MCAKIITFVFIAAFIGGAVSLRPVGMADGRAFYAESFYNGIARTWQEALEYCQGFGMSLGEILTQDQFAILNSTTDPQIRTGSGFWTGARDSHTHHQLKWGHGGEATSDEFMEWELQDYLGDYKTCAYFYLPETGPGRMEIATCSTTKTGVLCQM